MFGIKKRQTAEEQTQKEAREQRTKRTRQALADANSQLKDASRYRLVTGESEKVEKEINLLAAAGWTTLAMSANSRYGYDGRHQLHVLMENPNWNREALEAAQTQMQARQMELNSATDRA